MGGGDLFDHRAVMDSDFSGVSGSDQNFEFAFNSSNFSDRVLRIEIMEEPPGSKSDGEGGAAAVEWARHPKRKREEIKKDKGHRLVPDPRFLRDLALFFYVAKIFVSCMSCLQWSFSSFSSSLFGLGA